MRVGDTVADKPGRMISEDVEIQILESEHPYVGRGGLKLEQALAAFQISATGKIAADIGASTGGFTDCLLQNGAQKVFAVDVGYGQLDWKLRSDPRVVCIDRKNARDLVYEDLGVAPDLAVVDVSFISLKLVFPPLMKIMKPEGDIIALVKPQFEVGKDEVENKGIIKDPEKHLRVLVENARFIQKQGWVVCGVTTSPITGQKGNREFLIHVIHEQRGSAVDEAVFHAEVFQ